MKETLIAAVAILMLRKVGIIGVSITSDISTIQSSSTGVVITHNSTGDTSTFTWQRYAAEVAGLHHAVTDKPLTFKGVHSWKDGPDDLKLLLVEHLSGHVLLNETQDVCSLNFLGKPAIHYIRTVDDVWVTHT